ncbi:hypothetical protein KIPB_008679, partial [Kipferlia bialata]
ADKESAKAKKLRKAAQIQFSDRPTPGHVLLLEDGEEAPVYTQRRKVRKSRRAPVTETEGSEGEAEAEAYEQEEEEEEEYEAGSRTVEEWEELEKAKQAHQDAITAIEDRAAGLCRVRDAMTLERHIRGKGTKRKGPDGVMRWKRQRRR